MDPLAAVVDPRARASAPSWDRDRWVRLADDLLLAIRPWATAGCAQVHLPGRASASGRWSDGLEGYARTFLLAAFRVRGAGGDDPHGHLERYADGLRHGTDPTGPERWPRISERRQAVVEAASVAVALHETRPWLWDRLDDATRTRTVDWLAGIVGTSGYRNNWIWFQNVVEAFLASVGGPWDPADLARNDALAESLYVGDGWYSDGRSSHGRAQTFDWYAGWAWHLYPLLRARIEGRPLEDVHARRLREYLVGAQHLVGSDGAPVLHGRSLTYRFAVLAPVWAGALAGVTPLAPGQTRLMASRVVEHFVGHGALDEHGLLTTGWHGPHDGIRQLYSGPASPYWASKGFLGLLLPPSDPVWTAPDEVPGAWVRDGVTALPVPGWLVVRTPRDGTVRLLNHGADRVLEPAWQPRADDPFYGRLGYSNRTSPQLTGAAIVSPEDSHVALLDPAGTPSHRDGVEPLHVGARAAVSSSRTHWLVPPGAGSQGAATWAGLRRGPRLIVASVVRGAAEVRLAWWRADDDGAPGTGAETGTGTVTGTGPEARGGRVAGGAGMASDDPADDVGGWLRATGPFPVHLGGWSLAAADEDGARVETGPGRVLVRRSDGTSSLLRGLRGLDVGGTTPHRDADPLGAVSITPWLRSTGPVAAGQVVAALVVLTGGGAPVDGDGGDHGTGHGDGVLDEDVVEEVRPCGEGVEVRWRGGAVDLVVGPGGALR